MIPGNKLSSPSVPANFLSPDNLPVALTYSWQLGGIALSDASKGLEYQNWYLQIVNGTDAVISSPNTAQTTLFTLPSLSSVSLAFDQNMKPAVAYVSSGTAGLWWYDTTIPAYSFLTLPNGSTFPQATLDDKRNFSIQGGLSDIIVSYINTNNLYFRMLRDRFTIEYLLLNNITTVTKVVNPKLEKIGMGNNYRLQFSLEGSIYQ